MAVAAQTFVYGELTLPRWNAVVPVAYPKGNRKERYVPFRTMCGVIGVERTRQLSIVKKEYRGALRSLPLETTTGVRPALWMRTGECALWISRIDPARCKLETQERLMQFKQDFVEAAERVLFDGPRKGPEKRGMFAHSERMEYLFSCLYCGGGHRLIAQNGEVTLERYEF